MTSGTRRATDYAAFTDALLSALTSRGFLGDPAFIWSQHNYADILYDLGPAVNGTHLYTAGQAYQTNRAATTRMKLVNGGWSGYSDANTGPQSVWLTEGGADIQKVSDTYYGTSYPNSFATDAYQRAADLSERAWIRVHNDNANSGGQNGGSGIGLFSNYLWYSSAYPNDTGLCEPSYSGATRKSYAKWKTNLIASP